MLLSWNVYISLNADLLYYASINNHSCSSLIDKTIKPSNYKIYIYIPSCKVITYCPSMETNFLMLVDHSIKKSVNIILKKNIVKPNTIGKFFLKAFFYKH